MGEKKENQGGIAVATREKIQVKRPPMFRVILLNDDFTPMDFVVSILKTIFQKSEEEAQQVMLEVHHTGFGVAGTYQFDIAETKAQQVHAVAHKLEHPLRCSVERE
jgi:ATP-dependent Clp protease adaptor protein ClpS